MLKRYIAIFLLVLASAAWLAHAILPHHHHSSQACLQIEHCQHDRDHNSHPAETDSHQHDNNTSTNCALDQLAIVPQPILKGYSGVPEPPQLDTYYDFIQAFVAHASKGALLSPKSNTFYNDSVSTTLYLEYIGQSVGLRAPPVV